MAVFDNMPYTNFHELNADWLISVAKDADKAASEINEKIQAETDRATAKENELSAAITTETQRAMNRENSLSQTISDVNLRLTNQIAENKRQTDIADEALQEQIDNNAAKIAKNSADITAEKNRAIAAEAATDRRVGQVVTHQTLQDEKIATLYTEEENGTFTGSSLYLLSGKTLIATAGVTATTTPEISAPSDGVIARALVTNGLASSSITLSFEGFAAGSTNKGVTLAVGQSVFIDAFKIGENWYFKHTIMYTL